MGAFEIKRSLYVCIYIPEFSAQSLLRLRPELTDVPVAVLTGEPPFERICSINAHAGKLGVTEGMTRSELECFPSLFLLRRSKQEERAARSVLMEALSAFTPRIEGQSTPASALMMVLDMTGTTKIFGDPRQAVDKIAKSVRALSFYAQFATSANFHAATCVAPSARKGIVFLVHGNEAEHLRELPLSVLTLSPKQSDTFSLWGLHTLGELADLPEAELVVRLGQEGKRLRLLARGEHAHLFVPEEPVFVLEEFVAFDTPVEQLDSLLFALRPMLDQLLARVKNRALALASVAVTLALDGGGEHVRTIKPALPVLRWDVLLKLIHLDLQAHPPCAGVVSVFLRAEPGERSNVQAGLFAPQLPDPVRLDVTLARIAAVVGEERVGRPRLKDTHRADSFAMERFIVPTTDAKKIQKTRATFHRRRYRPPLALSVQQEGKRLTAFSLHGKRYKVEKVYGPWRRSGDWWATDVWSHEEWDVHAIANLGDTLLCLVSHDLLHHRWQLEALYD